MLFNVHKISIKIGLSFSVTLLGLWYNYRVSVVINKVAAELKITKLALSKKDAVPGFGFPYSCMQMGTAKNLAFS